MPTKAELIRENERLWSLLLALTNAKQPPAQVYGKPGISKTYTPALPKRKNAAAFGFSGGRFDPQQAALDLIALKDLDRH